MSDKLKGVKVPNPTFTKQDAENLIHIAQRAPLQNLAEAAAVSQLLERFKSWYEANQNERPS